MKISNIKDVIKKDVLVKNDAIKMICFAFEKGEGLPNHTHDGMAVIQVVEGIINFSFVNGSAEILKAGDLMEFDAKMEHNLIADVSSRIIVTIII